MSTFLRYFFTFVLTTLVFGCLAWLALWKTQGLHFYSIQTASMTPLLQPGDLAVSVKSNSADLRPGDIVSYQSAQPGGVVVTHRIYQTDPRAGYMLTKGDNLANPDPPVAYNSITGKTIKAIPKLGYVFDFVRKPVGLISLVYLPALIIAAYELHRAAARISYRSYRASPGL